MPEHKEIIVDQKNLFFSTSVGEYQNQLFKFLSELSLPNENVLVEVEQRSAIIQNIPTIMGRLPEEARAQAFYISKFIAACSAGLFDAALNYIWNETIENLKLKIELFDLEYFKGTISDDNRKDKIQSIDDLKLVDDWELVRGCAQTGIISDIGFKHLDYIRDMRNWASAAHPNQIELTGLQLCAWLEICIIEVIGKEPSRPAIEAGRLLKNIRENELTPDDIPPIQRALDRAPIEIISSLFKTIFGMFCDPDLKVETRNNIRLIANDVWKLLPEAQRKEAGLKNANWASNADIQRRDLSKEFLELVNGLSYLSKDTLTLELANSINLLLKTHFAMLNFYNEPPHAKMLYKLVPENGKIPESVRFSYVKTVCLCLIGNGFGVSFEAYPIYEKLFNKFTIKEMKEFVKLFEDKDFSSRMQLSKCVKNYKEHLHVIKERISDENLTRVIDYIERNEQNLSTLGLTTEYKRLIKLLN